MKSNGTNAFTARIEIIGINPFVFLPEKILQIIFRQVAKDRGPIPVRGTVNQQPFRQTLVKYAGAWRLYINTIMLKNSPSRIGERILITIEFDPADRTLPLHPKLQSALEKSPKAKLSFEKLPPSRKKEIIRYLSNLKNEISIDKNIARTIRFLLGKERFVGRDKP